MYTVEKCLAISEVQTMGELQKVFVIGDPSATKSGQVSHPAPKKSVIQGLKHFGLLYPERLKTLVVLEPPWWVRPGWAIIKQLVSKDTQEKVTIISTGANRTQRDEEVEKILDERNASPRLLPGGMLDDIETMDMDYYYYGLPFHCTYDRLREQ